MMEGWMKNIKDRVKTRGRQWAQKVTPEATWAEMITTRLQIPHLLHKLGFFSGIS